MVVEQTVVWVLLYSDADDVEDVYCGVFSSQAAAMQEAERRRKARTDHTPSTEPWWTDEWGNCSIPIIGHYAESYEVRKDVIRG